MIAILFTPLIGLILAIMLKQTTLAKLRAHGLRQGDGGLLNSVLLAYAMPLTMLVLFISFPSFPSCIQCEKPTTSVGFVRG